jgi:FAD:protein FMN transferase
MSSRTPPDFGFAFSAMASRCEIRIAGLTRRQAAPLAALAIAEVRRIEAKYSRYLATSVVARINAAAGSGQSLRVDAETAGLLQFADALYASSGALFDITSGCLRRVWDFRAQRVPTQTEIALQLRKVGWHRVNWSGTSIALTEPGMEIDFGGIGKEYAADRAATLLQAHGVAHGLVNLGGDIRVMGPRLQGLPWQLGIQDPRCPGQLTAHLSVGLGALATSGDYERYFEAGGKRYCHILDPRTGWPVTHWRSVSVLAPACLASGALSTVAMLKGPDSIAFLAAQNVAYLAVDAQGQRHASAHLLATNGIPCTTSSENYCHA